MVVPSEAGKALSVWHQFFTTVPVFHNRGLCGKFTVWTPKIDFDSTQQHARSFFVRFFKKIEK